LPVAEHAWGWKDCNPPPPVALGSPNLGTGHDNRRARFPPRAIAAAIPLSLSPLAGPKQRAQGLHPAEKLKESLNSLPNTQQFAFRRHKALILLGLCKI